MTSREGEGGGEDVGGGEGEGGEVDSSVWEEQLQQELQDLELQVHYVLYRGCYGCLDNVYSLIV